MAKIPKKPITKLKKLLTKDEPVAEPVTEPAEDWRCGSCLTKQPDTDDVDICRSCGEPQK